MKKKLIIAFVVLVAILASAALVLLAVYNGIIIPNDLSASRYPVKGVDVSHYQGEINWDVLASQNISFAFVKATEGSSYVDPCFKHNYDHALKTDLRVGAYHFFSFDSAGETQADNFIANVKKDDSMLPPVIDLEFYGDKAKNPPDKTDVQENLIALLEKLRDHYGKMPIIYTTEESYEMYLAGAFSEYDIWIRNVIFAPKLSDNRDWTFWQYTNRGRLDGYNGEEKYIDMNVFNGTAEEFWRY